RFEPGRGKTGGPQKLVRVPAAESDPMAASGQSLFLGETADRRGRRSRGAGGHWRFVSFSTMAIDAMGRKVESDGSQSARTRGDSAGNSPVPPLVRRFAARVDDFAPTDLRLS